MDLIDHLSSRSYNAFFAAQPHWLTRDLEATHPPIPLACLRALSEDMFDRHPTALYPEAEARYGFHEHDPRRPRLHKHHTRYQAAMAFPLNKLPLELRRMIWSHAIESSVQAWRARLRLRFSATLVALPTERPFRIVEMRSLLKISHVCREARQVHQRLSREVSIVLRNGAVENLRLPRNTAIHHGRVYQGTHGSRHVLLNHSCGRVPLDAVPTPTRVIIYVTEPYQGRPIDTDTLHAIHRALPGLRVATFSPVPFGSVVFSRRGRPTPVEDPSDEELSSDRWECLEMGPLAQPQERTTQESTFPATCYLANGMLGACPEPPE